MDKLRAVTFFCRAVEAKTFVAAAHSLDVVPSALSKVIAALEHELGFRLMNRSTRRLSLTPEGSADYEHCRQLLQELEEVEARAREGRTHARGTLRIGMHPAFRFAVLTELQRYFESNPQVKLETVITNSPAAIVDDGLDIVIRIGRLSDSGLVARKLGVARVVVCASPGYIAARGEPHHPRELAHHTAIIYGRHDEDPNTRWEFTKDAERQVVEVPVSLITRDGIGLMDAAVGGCGIARPFDVAAHHLIRTGQLRVLLPDWSGEPHPIYAVMPSHRGATPAKVRAFLDFVLPVLEMLSCRS